MTTIVHSACTNHIPLLLGIASPLEGGTKGSAMDNMRTCIMWSLLPPSPQFTSSIPLSTPPTILSLILSSPALPLFLPLTISSLHWYTFVWNTFRSLTLLSLSTEMPGNALDRARWSSTGASSLLLLCAFASCHWMATSFQFVSSKMPLFGSNHLDVYAERRTYSEEQLHQCACISSRQSLVNLIHA